MSSLYSISGDGTENPTPAAPHLIPVRRRTTSELGELFDSITGPPGNSFTPSCIDDPEENTNTSEDCDFEFIMSGESFHPVIIVCSTHGESGAISW